MLTYKKTTINKWRLKMKPLIVLKVIQKLEENIELKTRSQFVKKCAAVTTGNQRVCYYYCNRAGLYKPEGQGERQLKIQGTTKIGHQCSAYIKATENLVDKTVQVSYLVFNTLQS